MKKKTSSTTSPVWFDKGLRFTCRRCGTCCTGEPGFVFVGGEEIKVIAAFLDMDEGAFRKAYTRRAGRRISLTEKEDGRCVFFEDRCLIYEVRPIQCSSFPFWLWNVMKREHWESQSRDCPGMDRGRLFTREEIEDRLLK